MTSVELEQRAAKALERGDPLAALNALSGNEGAHGRALRGIALAQMQEFDSAQRELGAAAKALRDEPVHRARALAALAEVAAARREVGTALESLATVAAELEAMGDRRNGAWARLVRVRILLLTGSVDEARSELEQVTSKSGDDPVLAAAFALAHANSSVRVLSTDDALGVLERALAELSRTEHPLLAAELDAHRAALTRPFASLRMGDRSADLTLPQLAAVFRGGGHVPIDNPRSAVARYWLIVDAIGHRVVFCGEDAVDLSARAVLFRLLEELALSWPAEVTTPILVERVFDGPAADEQGPAADRGETEESYRDRLRVEIGRLRGLLPPGVKLEALGNAWRLVVADDAGVVHVSLPEKASALTALLADGSAWAARDLALALGTSQRSVQRALNEVAEQGAVQPVGEARARRWIAPDCAPGIASQMLLVSLLAPRR